MNVFITGVTGQLGYDCARECLKRGYLPTGCGIRMQSGQFSLDLMENGLLQMARIPYLQLDLTREDCVFETVGRIRPDVILHCAAYTNVDAAELVENREQVFAINTGATGTLAKAAEMIGAKMVFISSDYVFDGSGDAPWKPEDEATAALNVYGQSKLEGERAAGMILENLYIVRTSWVFGITGNNFVRTMLQAGMTHDSVKVVCDQVGLPTYSVDLASLLLDMAARDRYGCYHAANTGEFVSRYGFCQEIFRQSGIETEVIPVLTEDYPSIASRPLNSRLDTRGLIEAGFSPLPSWKDALGRYLEEMEARRR